MIKDIKAYTTIGIPKKFAAMSVDDIDTSYAPYEKIKKGVQKYCDNLAKENGIFNAPSLLITGTYGSGKSMIAALVLKQFLGKHYASSWFLTLDDVYELVSESWKSDENKDYRDKKLFNSRALVIDNIPHSLNKSREIKEVLPLILRKRATNGGVTIITTAEPTNMWSKVFGVELISLLSEDFLRVEMPEFDFRNK